ncbi:hypothetical protein DPMN_083316, partial [Dreissena polymorpha]
WRLFIGVPNIGGDILDSWENGTKSTLRLDKCFDENVISCNQHFRDPIVDRWNTIGVQRKFLKANSADPDETPHHAAAPLHPSDRLDDRYVRLDYRDVRLDDRYVRLNDRYARLDDRYVRLYDRFVRTRYGLLVRQDKNNELFVESRRIIRNGEFLNGREIFKALFDQQEDKYMRTYGIHDEFGFADKFVIEVFYEESEQSVEG